MLRARLVRSVRANSDDVIVRSGGFKDPWFASSRFTDYRYGMEHNHEQFPTYDDLRVPVNRPTENQEWAMPRTKFGLIRTGPTPILYDPAYSGYTPKPTWLLTQKTTGKRVGSFPGGSAKAVWKPPGKGQRSIMKQSYEPEVPPREFMEEYTQLNTTYTEDMDALRLYFFRRYTEPVIVEEEAFAQVKGI